MMQRIKNILLLITLIVAIFAQEKSCIAQGEFAKEWVYTIDSIGSEPFLRYDSQVDSMGSIYIVGGFKGIVDFSNAGNPIINSGNYLNGFILKLDSSGVFQWVKTIESNLRSRCLNLHITASNDLYITGDYSGTAVFQQSPLIQSTTNGMDDLFLLKMSDQGNLIWVNYFGGPLEDLSNSISVTSTSVYSLFQFKDTLDADPGSPVSNLISNGGWDLGVVQFDLSGNYVNSFSFGSTTGHEWPGELHADINDEIYINGGFISNFDLDPGPGVHTITNNSPFGYNEIFIMKLTQNGDLLWGDAYGGDYGDYEGKIIVDSSYIYLSGIFNDTVDFNVGANDSILVGSNSFFLLQLDKNGNFNWVEKIPRGQYISAANSLCLKNDHEVVFASGYNGQMNLAGGSELYFNPGENGNCIFVFDSLSNVTESISIQNVSNLAARAISVIPYQDDFILSGVFKNIADWNPNLSIDPDTSSTTNNVDLFSLKLSPCSNSTGDTIAISSCVKYTSPNTGQEWFQSGYVADVLPNSTGCDSLFIVDLTILQPDTVWVYESICDSNFLWHGHLFDSSGIYSTSLNNSYGCDSVVFLDLTLIEPIINVLDFGNYLWAGNQQGYSYQWLDCNNGYSILVDDTNSVLLLTHSGSFAVEYTLNGCSDTSSCFVIENLSLSELDENEGQFYPVPSSGTIYLQNTLDKISDIQVYDIRGVKIMELGSFESGNKFETGLSDGVYVVNWVYNGKNFSQRIVILR